MRQFPRSLDKLGQAPDELGQALRARAGPSTSSGQAPRRARGRPLDELGAGPSTSSGRAPRQARGGHFEGLGAQPDDRRRFSRHRARACTVRPKGPTWATRTSARTAGSSPRCAPDEQKGMVKLDARGAAAVHAGPSEDVRAVERRLGPAGVHRRPARRRRPRDGPRRHGPGVGGGGRQGSGEEASGEETGGKETRQTIEGAFHPSDRALVKKSSLPIRLRLERCSRVSRSPAWPRPQTPVRSRPPRSIASTSASRSARCCRTGASAATDRTPRSGRPSCASTRAKARFKDIGDGWAIVKPGDPGKSELIRRTTPTSKTT